MIYGYSTITMCVKASLLQQNAVQAMVWELHTFLTFLVFYRSLKWVNNIV